MSKLLKRLLIAVVAIVIVGLVGRSFLRSSTKKHSPEQIVEHSSKKANFEVFYNRPSKKGRVIFGDLVPFGEVWRTGANEATTFTTDNDILVDGSILKEGTYSLWTVPNQDSWKVIFNGYQYDWGVSLIDGTPARDPEYDVLTIEVPVHRLLNVVEQFSIYFEEANNFTIMYLAWDQTAIAIPLKS
ncbi:DUF2911 domain-containing protein [Aquimarina sp. 2201CG14-23]|uniref:DUF2911 domain-containing protein n=1 Tax=Aquimarina mycalae TaxID=3040073 RepID=UPI0024780ECA|nr:DUF2911 domain-containing protein [Aquimarina sp. 2201CG14-23]MDH7444448.1 DUF2911 domain-containing protein [Aquimarina sp. 2201CG14-23]